MKYKVRKSGIVFEILNLDEEVVGVFSDKYDAYQYVKSLESKRTGFEGYVPSFFFNGER